MMIKNTKEKMTIKNMITGKRIFVTSGVVLTSLCLSLPVKKTNDIDSSFNNYAKVYLESSKKLEDEKFDPVFKEFYDTGTVEIDDDEYTIKELYLETMNDDKSYLIKAGEKVDLLTSLPFEGERKSILAFRKASFLYDIYEDGYINDNMLKIDKDKLQEYLDNWDLKQHSKVRSLKVEQEANKEYHEQYGKKR